MCVIIGGMVVQYLALLRARVFWPGPILRAHVVPTDVLSLGFRLMVTAFRISLLSFPLMVVALACAGDSATLESGFQGVLLAVTSLSWYVILVGKLACLLAPVGRWLVAGHLLLLPILAFCTFQAPWWLALVGCSSLFLAFLSRLGTHYGWTAMLRRLRLTVAVYSLALVGPAVSFTALSAGTKESIYLACTLLAYAGMWIYSGCLAQASRALSQSARPVRPFALCRDLAVASLERLKHRP